MSLIDDPRVETLPERRFAVRLHDGGIETIEETRRPLYQHMIMDELVGGPPVLRFEGDRIDVLVGATCGFDGDDVVTVEILPEARYAVADFEGPEDDLPAARAALLEWVASNGHTAAGPVLQVHLMDAIDGETEQEIQVPLA